MRIPSGTTNRHIYFVAVDETDLKTRETALSSFTVYYEIANGAATAMTTPTVTEADATNMPGVYTLLIDESGMTTLTAGHDTAELCVHITHAGMAPVTRTIEIYRAKFTEGQTATMANSAVDADIERLQGSAIATPTTAGVLEVDLTHIAGSAVSTSTAQLGVNVVNAGGTAWASGSLTSGVFATGAITATAIAADAIGASELAADAVAEIADAVWDEDATAHQTGGTFGQAIGDPGADTNTIFKAVVTDASGATVGVDTTAIKTKTDFLPSATAGDAGGVMISGANTGPWSVSGGVTFSNSGGTALTLQSTGGNGSGLFATANGSGDGISGVGGATSGEGISAYGGGIGGHGFLCEGSGTGTGLRSNGGATGNGATFVGGGTSGHGIQATVTSGNEIDADIVGAITGNITGNLSGSVGSVTGAVGSVAAGGITAASIATNAVDADALAADAVTEIVSGVLTTAMTEAYAADGVAPTLAQALFAIQQFLQEKAISGTTLTVNKLDGTTAAMTFTLDSATAPTSVTRSS